jgi:hypothetical protein
VHEYRVQVGGAIGGASIARGRGAIALFTVNRAEQVAAPMTSARLTNARSRTQTATWMRPDSGGQRAARPE